MANDPSRSDWVYQQPRWDDLRFPATGINPIGAASDPSIDTDIDSFPGSLLFSPSTVNYISCLVQLCHGRWRPGGMHPHIHYMRTSAGAGSIKWQARHRLIGNVGATAQGWSSWVDLIDAIPAAVPDVHLIASYDYLTDETLKDSAMFCFELRRLATDPADDYAGNARLLELDWHVQRISAGSEDEFT